MLAVLYPGTQKTIKATSQHDDVNVENIILKTTNLYFKAILEGNQRNKGIDKN